jgi:hypothetical protein
MLENLSKHPVRDFCYGDKIVCLSVCVCVCAVVNGSLDLAARAARLQTFLFDKAIQDAATEFTVQWQMHRARDARVFGCHSFVRRIEMHRVTSDYRKCWRAASTEALNMLVRLLGLKAFALYVIVAGCKRAPRTFPKRAHKRACSRLALITEPACRANSA